MFAENVLFVNTIVLHNVKEHSVYRKSKCTNRFDGDN
jgi:hypothetical protein